MRLRPYFAKPESAIAIRSRLFLWTIARRGSTTFEYIIDQGHGICEIYHAIAVCITAIVIVAIWADEQLRDRIAVIIRNEYPGQQRMEGNLARTIAHRRTRYYLPR